MLFGVFASLTLKLRDESGRQLKQSRLILSNIFTDVKTCFIPKKYAVCVMQKKTDEL